MINFIRISNNIKLGDYLHKDGTIDNIASNNVVGVCVIPSNFFPDRYARFISLTQTSLYHQWRRDISLKSEYKITLPGKRKGEEYDWGYINEGKGSWVIINPYLPNDSFNPEFLRDLPYGNAFQDYKGYENMKLYKEKYGNNEFFSNAFTEAIKNSPSYKEEDWYLPAIGELAFIPPRFMFIRDKIYKSLIMGSKGTILSSGYFWSSSERGSMHVWYAYTDVGYVGYLDKNLNNGVRAFLAL